MTAYYLQMPHEENINCISFCSDKAIAERVPRSATVFDLCSNRGLTGWSCVHTALSPPQRNGLFEVHNLWHLLRTTRAFHDLANGKAYAQVVILQKQTSQRL